MDALCSDSLLISPDWDEAVSVGGFHGYSSRESGVVYHVYSIENKSICNLVGGSRSGLLQNHRIADDLLSLGPILYLTEFEMLEGIPISKSKLSLVVCVVVWGGSPK